MISPIPTFYLKESIKYYLYDIWQTKFPVSRTFQSCKCFFAKSFDIDLDFDHERRHDNRHFFCNQREF